MKNIIKIRKSDIARPSFNEGGEDSSTTEVVLYEKLLQVHSIMGNCEQIMSSLFLFCEIF